MGEKKDKIKKIKDNTKATRETLAEFGGPPKDKESWMERHQRQAAFRADMWLKRAQRELEKLDELTAEDE